MENTPKLICSDIDGTLLNKDRALEDLTIKEIKRIRSEYNIPFILISARMPKAMTHLQQELEMKEAMVCFNGALVLGKEGQEITNEVMPVEAVFAVVEQIHLHNIHLSIFHKNEWTVNKMDYWAKREENNTKNTPIVEQPEPVINSLYNEGKGVHKLLLMGEEEKMDQIEALLTDNWKEAISIYRSKNTYIEINVKSVSKKTAVAKLAEYYCVPVESIVAFGDNDNDISMLDFVGHGVAVANAKDAVKAVANSITLSNKEHGVAHSLKTIFP